jgi:hypothetical protein
MKQDNVAEIQVNIHNINAGFQGEEAPYPPGALYRLSDALKTMQFRYTQIDRLLNMQLTWSLPVDRKKSFNASCLECLQVK